MFIQEGTTSKYRIREKKFAHTSARLNMRNVRDDNYKLYNQGYVCGALRCDHHTAHTHTHTHTHTHRQPVLHHSRHTHTLLHTLMAAQMHTKLWRTSSTLGIIWSVIHSVTTTLSSTYVLMLQ